MSDWRFVSDWRFLAGGVLASFAVFACGGVAAQTITPPANVSQPNSALAHCYQLRTESTTSRVHCSGGTQREDGAGDDRYPTDTSSGANGSGDGGSNSSGQQSGGGQNDSGAGPWTPPHRHRLPRGR